VLVWVSPAGATGRDEDGLRAVASYVAMQRYFYDVRSRRYREALGGAPNASAWPLSQAVAAAIAVSRLSASDGNFQRGTEARVEALERYRQGSTYSVVPGNPTFYLDDNEWLAQDMLDWDAVRPSAERLSRAAGIFAAAVRSWDADGSHPCTGGVYWTTTVHGVADRNVVSTANGAIVGLRIYSLTHQPVYLYWSRRMLDWEDQCLRGPDGLYWDHISADGTIDETVWSYNQGSVIGALVLLARATGDTAPIAQAESAADAALSYFQATRLAAEPVEFAAIFFRNLLALAAVDGRQRYVDAARAYADMLWESRDPQTGLIALHAPDRLLDQAGATDLFAELARAGP
jgi:hypothetical protein